MREYNYKDIAEIDKNGIWFKDGEHVDFEECRANWGQSRGVSKEGTCCVAIRNITGNLPYFLFSDNKKTRITFKKAIFPYGVIQKRRFIKLQRSISCMGYSTYDCS